MSDIPNDESEDDSVVNAFIGRNPVEAIYLGRTLLWPGGRDGLGSEEIMELLQNKPRQGITAEAFEALENPDDGVAYLVVRSLHTGPAPGRHRLQ